MTARKPKRPRNPAARALRTQRQFKPKVVQLKTRYTPKGRRRPEEAG